LSSNLYEAIRRRKTYEGYRKGGLRVTLPTLSDLNLSAGHAAYNYLGVSSETAQVDCEFGIAYAPGACANCDQFWLFYVSYPGFWGYIDAANIQIASGEYVEMTLATNDNELYCRAVVDGMQIIEERFNVSGLRWDGVGQVIRGMTTLVIGQNGPVTSCYSNYNKIEEFLVGTTSVYSHFDSEGNVYEETKPSGREDSPDNWVKSYVVYPNYKETVHLKITP